MDSALPLDPRVIESHVAGARRLARALLGDPDAADDAVQDAFVVALTSPPRAGWDFRAWLGGVVRNKAREQRRALARRAASLAGRDVPSDADVPDLGERMETQRRLFAAVYALPEIYRSIVWLRHFEDLPPRVVAVRLAIPVETVRTRNRRALALLRDSLEEKGVRRWPLALLPLADGARSGGGTSVGLGGVLMTLGTKSVVGIGAAAVAAVVAIALLLGNEEGGVAGRSEERAAVDPAPSDAPTLEGRPAPVAAPAGVEPGPTAAVPTWAVTGRVLDEDGSPLDGAEVLWGAEHALDAGGMTPLARTGPDGKFRAALSADLTRARVLARAPGRRPSPALLWRSRIEYVEFRLVRQRDLRIRVLDADTGEPLEGVRLEAVVEEDGQEAIVLSTTAADGTATVPDTETTDLDQPAKVRLAKDGYEPLFSLQRPLVKARHGSTGRTIDVYLRRGTGLALRVVDESGRPVPDAEVEGWTGRGGILMTPANTTEGGISKMTVAGFLGLGAGRSDERGEVTLGVADERSPWWVLARRGPEAGFAWGSSRPKAGARGDVVLRPAFDVVGRVVSEDGKPLAGAWVRFDWIEVATPGGRGLGGSHAIVPMEIDGRGQAITDAEGRFRLPRVPIRGDGAEQWLLANHADAVGRERLVAPTAGTPSAETTITVKSLGDPVRVRVVDDATGEPVAGAAVSWDRLVPTTPADADGVAVRHRHRGGTMGISVHAPGYAPYVGEGPPAEDRVEVRLRRARALEGRVLDDEGNPLSTYVDVFDPSVAALPTAERDQRQVYGPGWLARAESGGLGTFRVSGLPPGPVFVRAWVSRRVGKEYRWPKAEALTDATSPVELRLPADARAPVAGQDVSGAVFTADGVRLTRYVVTLEGEGRHSTPVQSAWQFLFVDVPPGTYALVASQPDGKKTGRLPVIVREGEDLRGLRVVLGDTATLAARFVPPAGMAVADLSGLRVSIVREGRAWGGPEALTDASGSFRAADLEPGRYRVAIRAPRPPLRAWQVAEPLVDLRAGTESRDLPIVPAGRLFLVLDDDRFDDNPIVEMERVHQPKVQAAMRVRVVVRGKDLGEVQAFGLFRGRHACEWSFLPGAYELGIESSDHGSFRSTFRVEPGVDAEVRVVLR